MIVIELPWPSKHLSPNARCDRRAITEVRRAYKAACHLATIAARPPAMEPTRHAVLLVFHPPNRARRDLDNLLGRVKYGLDGVAAALRIDDSLFRPITIDVGEALPHGLVRMTVTPIAQPEPPQASIDLDALADQRSRRCACGMS